MLFTFSTFSACSLLGPSESDIQIQDEQFYIEARYLNLELKIKNTSSSRIKTCCKVNFYKNGAVFTSILSRIITLDAGETGITTGDWAIGSDVYSNYTYKITGWNFYEV